MRYIKQIVFSILLAGCLTLSLSATAQSVQFLGFTNDGLRAQVKAKLLDLNTRQPVSVNAYSFNSADGYTVVNRTFDVVNDGDETYLSADVYFHPDKTMYRHRLEIIFDDGSTYLSPVVNEDLTEAFMWLTDYDYAQGQSGWDASHPPTKDREIDPSLVFLLDGVHYYKGLSNHARGYVLYTFDNHNFTKFISKFGVQDDRTEGNLQFMFYTSPNVVKGDVNTLRNNMQLIKQQHMFSKGNTADSGKTGPYVDDIEIDFSDKKSLMIYLDEYNGNNYGDHGQLALARFELPAPAVTAKQKQEVSFLTQPQVLDKDIVLEAEAPGGKVYYRIISGRDLAVIKDGNIISPVWGGKGAVVVEATQYGNDEFYPATSYLTFEVDTEPTLTMLDVYRPTVIMDGAVKNNPHVYMLLDTKGRELDQLNITVYNNPEARVKQGNVINLMPKYYPSKGRQVLDIEIPDFQNQVLKLAYSYKDSEKVDSLPYWHIGGNYDYISDLTPSAYTTKMGYGTFPGANNTYGHTASNATSGDNGNKLSILNNGNVVYAKGFGMHATCYVEIKSEYLAPYYRVAADMGTQIGYGGNVNQRLGYQVVNGNTLLFDRPDVTKNNYVTIDETFNNQTWLRLVVNNSDGDANDHVCIGAARLYYSPVIKPDQSLEWISDSRLVANNPVEIKLDAKSSAELPVYYYIVKGSEFAHIEGDVLTITNFPNGGAEVIVDAYQPGDDVIAPSAVSTCIFSLVHGLEVQAHEDVQISGPEILDELIIHAKKDAVGQVTVKKGLVDVKKLVLKYTFKPNEWNYISFPSDIDVDKVSNLRDLGYVFNGYGVPAYTLSELDEKAYFDDVVGNVGWKLLETPKIEGLKGYLLRIEDSKSTEPVEVVFSMDNVNVDLANIVRVLGLSLDFTHNKPGETIVLTVSSANPSISSNNLTISTTFSPSDTSSLPLNYENALEKMRYVFVNGHKAIRLTLPDQTPARVVLFDKKGKKILKAVKYVAPNVIDLSDLESGSYKMAVSYGPALRTMEIDL